MGELTEYENEIISSFLEEVDAATTADELTNLAREVARKSHIPCFARNTWPRLAMKLDRLKQRRRPRKFIAVDVMQMIHATYHTAPTVADAVNIVLGSLHDIREHYRCPVIIANDSPVSLRRESAVEFKSKREAPAEEFLECRKAILDEIINQWWPMLEISGYEADDVIASVALTNSIWGDETIIESNDRDMWQCLGPLVKTHHKKTGFFTVSDLLSEHKITPSQVPTWLALTGKNDMPKPAKIGPVNASKLLEQYKTWDELYANRHETPYADSITEFLPMYDRVIRIHTLNKYLPIPVAFLDCAYEEVA